MIIISLNGGLGNQLFQYALGRRLSYERKVSLRFDLNALETPPSIRQYKLAHFQAQGQPASEIEKEQFFARPYFKFWEKSISKVKKIPLSYRQRIVNESVFTFDENILRVSPHVCLQGYWQTEKYFFPIRELLQKELQLNTPLDPLNQKLLASIRAENSVSVHIRRGDYVSNPETNKAHGVLPLSYYEAAIKLMNEKVSSPHFHVFSDDIPWARKNILGLENVTFVDHNDSECDYLDLMLMKACKYHITANSSFSWWGAWLSDYENKIAIAPKKWYQTDQDTRDLFPEDWIKI